MKHATNLIQQRWQTYWMTNKEKGILAKLRKETRSKNQKCYTPLCKSKSIRSHIQQVEGSIRNISSGNRTVVQLEDLDPRFNVRMYGFKEKGIKQKGNVLTFWGFCNKCDTEIFKEIESGIIDFNAYRNQLLYSYRGFLSEHYKQEYNIKWFERIFSSKDLNSDIKKEYQNEYNLFNLLVKTGKHTKLLFEKDLNENTKNFEFINFVLPKIEICTSTAYSLPATILFNNDLLKALKTRDIMPPISSAIFVNLIPNENKLNVILGCHSDKDIKGKLDLGKIEKMNQKEKVKLISDILIKHVETWFVSVSLYNTWNDRKMTDEILKQIEKYKHGTMKNKHIKFNMFQDII